MTARPGDLGRLLHEIDVAEQAAMVDLAEYARCVDSGMPAPDPWEDDGESGTCLGRADW